MFCLCICVCVGEWKRARGGSAWRHGRTRTERHSTPTDSPNAIREQRGEKGLAEGGRDAQHERKRGTRRARAPPSHSSGTLLPPGRTGKTAGACGLPCCRLVFSFSGGRPFSRTCFPLNRAADVRHRSRTRVLVSISPPPSRCHLVPVSR